MSAQPNIQGEISTSSSRLVWVLNKDENYDYIGTCGGAKCTIPKDRQKIAKRFTEGGNLFPYMDAVQFVRDLKEPQGFEMDAMGKPQAIFRTKELYEKELTLEEFQTLVGKKPEEIKRELVKEEKKARRALTQELNKYPGKKIEVKDEDE